MKILLVPPVSTVCSFFLAAILAFYRTTDFTWNFIFQSTFVSFITIFLSSFIVRLFIWRPLFSVNCFATVSGFYRFVLTFAHVSFVVDLAHHSSSLVRVCLDSKRRRRDACSPRLFSSRESNSPSLFVCQQTPTIEFHPIKWRKSTQPIHSPLKRRKDEENILTNQGDCAQFAYECVRIECHQRSKANR